MSLILLPGPIAENGDKQQLTQFQDASVPNRMSYDQGTPEICSQDPNEGGLPPRRADRNQVDFMLSNNFYEMQKGSVYTFDQFMLQPPNNGYPLNALLWYFPPNGPAQILQSIKPNNTDNFIENPAFIGVSWIPVSSANNGLAMGKITYSQSNLEADNPGCIKGWTGEYIANAGTVGDTFGRYNDFYLWLKTHPELCTTKIDYDAILAEYGEVNKYVLDEVPGSIRFPIYRRFIRSVGSDGIRTLGKDQIVNITGSIGNKQEPAVFEGAFVQGPTRSGVGRNYGSDTVPTTSFDASRVVRTGDEVQPNFIAEYPWICVYNSTALISREVVPQETINQITASGGNINLNTNRMYKGTFSQDITFSLPTLINTAVSNQILIQAKITANITINWGTTAFFVEQPTPNIGSCNIIFEYDSLSNVWVAGVLNKVGV